MGHIITWVINASHMGQPWDLIGQVNPRTSARIPTYPLWVRDTVRGYIRNTVWTCWILNVNRWFPDHNSENRLPIPFMSKWSFVGLCLGYIDKTCPPFSDQSNCTLTSSDGYIYLSGARFESILQFLNLKTICFHSMTLISKYRLSATTSLQLLVVLGPQNKFYKNVCMFDSHPRTCVRNTHSTLSEWVGCSVLV